LTATSDGSVAIFDPATGTRVRALGELGGVFSMRWSPDGQKIAALTMGGDVWVWNVNGGILRKILAGTVGAVAIAFSNDSKWLVRSGEPADTLFAVDGGSDRKLLDAHQAAALVVAFSPDDKTVLVAGMGFLSTWDVASGAPRLRIATQGLVTAAAFFDDGRYVIAGGLDRRMHVWDAETGAELLAFAVPAQPIKLVIDGARIAILAGGSATVWNVPAFQGSLDDLRARARCSLDLEVVDALLKAHSIDSAACNRTAW
jgi:WD40 repeat protein